MIHVCAGEFFFLLVSLCVMSVFRIRWQFLQCSLKNREKKPHAHITAKSFSYSKSFISAFMRVFNFKTYIPIKMSDDLFHSSDLWCVFFFFSRVWQHWGNRGVKESIYSEKNWKMHVSMDWVSDIRAQNVSHAMFGTCWCCWFL